MLLQYILSINVAQFLPILVGLLIRRKNEYVYIVSTNAELGIFVSIFKKINIEITRYVNNLRFTFKC